MARRPTTPIRVARPEQRRAWLPPKHEIRSTKSQTNSNHQRTEIQNAGEPVLEPWVFDLSRIWTFSAAGQAPSATLCTASVPCHPAALFSPPPSAYNGFMDLKSLTALPVFNEAAHVTPVLDVVRRYSSNVLVVNDGSTDGTSDLLAARNDIHLITHSRNSGYGAAIVSAFDFALRGGYEVLVTIDCNGQHEPALIPHFVRTCMEGSADIVSGSRYLQRFDGASHPPKTAGRSTRRSPGS